MVLVASPGLESASRRVAMEKYKLVRRECVSVSGITNTQETSIGEHEVGVQGETNLISVFFLCLLLSNRFAFRFFIFIFWKFRLTSHGKMKTYLTAALSKLEREDVRQVHFKATGKAINKLVSVGK